MAYQLEYDSVTQGWKKVDEVDKAETMSDLLYNIQERPTGIAGSGTKYRVVEVPEPVEKRVIE